MEPPYIGEIRIFSFNFAPRGWAQCNGQQLQIKANQALFLIIGKTYGGDGVNNFNLPNLIGRTAVHPDQNILRGQAGGEAAHTLSLQEMPNHNHVLYGANVQADSGSPAGNLLAAAASGKGTWYRGGNPANPTNLGQGSIANAGSGQGHPNLQPYLVLNVCIALTGIYPPPP